MARAIWLQKTVQAYPPEAGLLRWLAEVRCGLVVVVLLHAMQHERAQVQVGRLQGLRPVRAVAALLALRGGQRDVRHAGFHPRGGQSLGRRTALLKAAPDRCGEELGERGQLTALPPRLRFEGFPTKRSDRDAVRAHLNPKGSPSGPVRLSLPG